MSLLLETLDGKESREVPIWYMRQAGRYLPEYNEIRRTTDFVGFCKNPELATTASMQPYKRFGMDAVIFFSDILTPFFDLGVRFEEKVGPILSFGEKELSKYTFSPEKITPYVGEILSNLRREINGLANTPRGKPALIGFCGAPFTLASYIIEGKSTRSFEKTKAFLYENPKGYETLAKQVEEICLDYLLFQFESGADVIQIFDSWGGMLSVEDYQRFAAPYTSRMIEALNKKHKRTILFVGNNAHLLPELAAQNSTAISLDWRVRYDDVERHVPLITTVQGNLDPLLLYGTPEETAWQTRAILDRYANRPRYIFNLGHGIHPASKMDCVESMVTTVKNYRRPS